MKYREKLLILIGILWVGFYPIVAFAQSALSINGDEQPLRDDNTDGIQVSVILDSPALNSLEFILEFDSNLIDISSSNVRWNVNRVPDQTGSFADEPDDEKIRFSASSSGINENTATVREGNGELLSFTVTPVAVGTVGTSPLTFSSIMLRNLNLGQEESSPTSGSITVVGDPVIFFSQEGSSTSEGSDTPPIVNVQISIPGGGTLSEQVSVDVTVDSDGDGGGTATNGEDFTGFDNNLQRLTFEANTSDLTKAVNINVANDNLVEGNETIILELENVTGEVELGSQTMHTVSITDDEIATVQFKDISSQVNEADAATTTIHDVFVELSIQPEGATLAAPVTIPIKASGTAIAGEDYIALENSNVTFPAESASLENPFSLTLINDNICKGDRSVKLELEISEDSVVTGGQQKSHLVQILEDEPFANNADLTATKGQQVDITITALRADEGGVLLASSISQPPENYDQPLADGFSTEKGGVLTGVQSIIDNGTATATMTWQPPADFTGVDRFFFIIRNSDGALSCEGRVTIAVDLPAWYPFFSWESISGFDWYNIRVYKSEDVPKLVDETNADDAEPVPSPVFETIVNGEEMAGERYLLAGFRGFPPGDYQFQVQGWNPITGISDSNSSSDQFIVLPTISYDSASIAEFSEGNINAIEPGLYELTFTANNARGFVVRIVREGDSLSFPKDIQKIFSPASGEDTIPFNQDSALLVNLNQEGIYHIFVGGFNPKDVDEENNELINFIEFPDTSNGNLTVGASEERTPTSPTGLFPGTGEVITIVEGEEEIDLLWEPVAGANSYVVYLGATDSSPILNYENVGNVTSHPISLPPGSYSWMVIALNEADSGPLFGPWSVSQRFDVVEKLDAPVIASAERVDEKNVKITWLPGAKPATVEAWHYNTTSEVRRWSIESALTVIEDPEITNSGTFGFMKETTNIPGEGMNYIKIRGKSGAEMEGLEGNEGEFKLFVLQ